jgi:hypothetical protein
VKGQLEHRVQPIAQQQDHPNAQSQAGIDTPVQCRHDEKIKILRPQEGESLHGRFQPATQPLREQVDDDLHFVQPIDDHDFLQKRKIWRALAVRGRALWIDSQLQNGILFET